MIKLPLFAAIATLSTCIPLTAQDAPPVAEAPKAATTPKYKTANEVSFALTDTFIEMFDKLVQVKDEAAAKQFNAETKAQTPKILALHEQLRALPKPTDAELQAFAEKAVEAEEQMSKTMQAMMGMMMDPANQEIAKIVQEGMGEFQQTTAQLQPTMEEYYPADKVQPLIDKIKADKAAAAAKEAPAE